MSEKKYDPVIVGEQIKQLLMFVQTIPDEALKDTIECLRHEETVGPLLDPTSFQGTKFKELSNRIKRCQAILDFKEILKETNENKEQVIKMELKTLKDLEKLKLRRLGDYENYLDIPSDRWLDDNPVVIREDDLRQSAIEDIKRLSKRPRDLHSGVRWRYSDKTMGKIDYIKEKFNIIKEDLK